jgi:error-prone DNA polymerase
MWPDYAELHCLSAFSFQRGASTPDELFDRAKALGYRALAITDECSLAGIVRAFEASRRTGVPLIIGSELCIEDGTRLVLLVADASGYVDLCHLITTARRRASKGQYRACIEDVQALGDGIRLLWLPPAQTSDELMPPMWLQEFAAAHVWMALECHHGTDDAARLAHLRQCAMRLRWPLLAAGDVHMHVRRRRALQDVLTAIRHHTTLTEAGFRLFPNGERHLRTRQALTAIYPADALAETLRLAEQCQFQLDSLRYCYPQEVVPAGFTADAWLRHLTWQGAQWRWPAGVPEKVTAQLEHELSLIAELGYAAYFLTVQDLVRFARQRGILCQGRGSAANSAVCFALGVTEVDPTRINLLFERFVSRERNEPPDIDIDFEHERREEVLQYVFSRYGRARAALTAVAISWRGRSAMREVAKVLGFAPDQIDELARSMDRWGDRPPHPDYLRERGFDPETPLMRRLIACVSELIGFPRHLSQHPGGFVISEHPLHTLVPVENAAMEGRTVIQWDKDDLDTLGLLKVDCLALGMLSAVRKCFDLLRQHGCGDFSMATIPPDDVLTYDMIGRADTIGVFQIESRAQMAMLPRLRPRCFYDLVIEVAIVRPGPIQGDMVHPYLRRRNGEEPIDYPPALHAVFERTLGVPLFQEQVMQLAILAADYSAGEADALRRSMAAWSRRGGLEPHRERLLQGMRANGYSDAFAERLFEQIKGFGSYGFPESHAASFALITYVSCWLKCHHPAAFACALINSQPMGFYSPDQLVQDVRRHGVSVLAIDVQRSEWDCTLVCDRHGELAVQLGLRLLQGFPQAVAEHLVRTRPATGFESVAALCQHLGLDQRQRALLADCGALKSLAGQRRKARWAVTGIENGLPLFSGVGDSHECTPSLPLPHVAEKLEADYALTGLTLGPHPLKLLREALRQRRCHSARELEVLPHGHPVRAAGWVRLRQRPSTAGGVTFLTLEDEHGMVNVVVWRELAERQRRILLESRLLIVDGHIERKDGVQHVIAKRLHNGSPLMQRLRASSRDFH